VQGSVLFFVVQKPAVDQTPKTTNGEIAECDPEFALSAAMPDLVVQ
jgi:hypothetical protein